jgi:hypothetical protein
LAAVLRRYKTKKPQELPCGPFTNSKGDTRATNATEKYHDLRFVASKIVRH